eukprot:gene22529-13176_t
MSQRDAEASATVVSAGRVALALRGRSGLPALLHPTGLELPGAGREGRSGNLRGPRIPGGHALVAANIGLVAGAAALAAAASAAAAAAAGRARWEVEGLLRVPTVPVVAWLVLAQGSTYGTVAWWPRFLPKLRQMET